MTVPPERRRSGLVGAFHSRVTARCVRPLAHERFVFVTDGAVTFAGSFLQPCAVENSDKPAAIFDQLGVLSRPAATVTLERRTPSIRLNTSCVSGKLSLRMGFCTISTQREHRCSTSWK